MAVYYFSTLFWDYFSVFKLSFQELDICLWSDQKPLDRTWFISNFVYTDRRWQLECLFTLALFRLSSSARSSIPSLKKEFCILYSNLQVPCSSFCIFKPITSASSPLMIAIAVFTKFEIVLKDFVLNCFVMFGLPAFFLTFVWHFRVYYFFWF
jgi:hypothetical protein